MLGTLSKLSKNSSDFRQEITGTFTTPPRSGAQFVIWNNKPLSNPEANTRIVETSHVVEIMDSQVDSITFKTDSGSIYKLTT